MGQDTYLIEPVAYIRAPFATKFGVPRQSGIVTSLEGRIVFEPKFRNPDALRGIEGFSHLWLVWGFSQARRDDGEWTPLVRPPRLGGNEKMGVFATRSPFRPNNLGLSAVELEGIEEDPDLGMVLKVRGADLVDGTPIYDIKPYIEYTDALQDTRGGFVDGAPAMLPVVISEEHRALLGSNAEALIDVLALDPRPAFHNDPGRVYGMEFAGFDVRFKVGESVQVISCERLS